MPPCVFYHCWFEEGEPSPHQNVRTPVVASIATLRSTCDYPIVVLDLSSREQDWSHYPETLNFQVHRIKGFYERVSNKVPGWKHLSRIPDVHNWATANRFRKIIYSDTDIFWFKSPREPNSGFTFNGHNSGFYYYDTAECTAFIELFCAYVLSAIHAPAIRDLFRQYCSYDGWYGVWDEMILGYMTKHNSDIIKFCEEIEHATFPILDRLNYGGAYMIHANCSSMLNPFPRKGAQHEHAPGVYAIAIKDIYRQLRETVSLVHLSEMYSLPELQYFLPRQFSINDCIKGLRAARPVDKPWLVSLDKFIREVPSHFES